MKCDELCVYKDCEDFQTFDRHFTEAYKKSDVDAAIAELKAEINRKEAVGKRWFEQCMEARAENVRLKRALWLARAERAKYIVEYWSCRGGTLLEHYPFCVNGDSPFNRLSEMGCLYGDTNERLKEAKFKHLYSSEWMIVWGNVERKCRAKAEEYK